MNILLVFPVPKAQDIATLLCFEESGFMFVLFICQNRKASKNTAFSFHCRQELCNTKAFRTSVRITAGERVQYRIWNSTSVSFHVVENVHKIDFSFPFLFLMWVYVQQEWFPFFFFFCYFGGKFLATLGNPGGNLSILSPISLIEFSLWWRFSLRKDFPPKD